MANQKEIRARISSTISTQQITKAMKMISAARLRKAQDRALAARPDDVSAAAAAHPRSHSPQPSDAGPFGAAPRSSGVTAAASPRRMVNEDPPSSFPERPHRLPRRWGRFLERRQASRRALRSNAHAAPERSFDKNPPESLRKSPLYRARSVTCGFPPESFRSRSGNSCVPAAEKISLASESASNGLSPLRSTPWKAFCGVLANPREASRIPQEL